MASLGVELDGALAAELGAVSVAGAGGGVDDTGGVVLAGAGGGVGEHAASSAMLVKGAISIKRRRVAGDTMMMSLADKRKVVKIPLSKTLQANGLQQE